ncbi:MAG: hypothetical protein ACOYYS_10490 [Chloroflexota bacterium]
MNKSSDKFLLIIVIGILLLVGVTFAAVLLVPQPDYRAEDAPESVLYNYLLAFEREDYERAYGYLSPKLKNYPADLEEFLKDIHSYKWAFDINAERPSSFRIVSSKTTGNIAFVEVEFSQYRGDGLFESRTDITTGNFRLARAEGVWKVTRGEYLFWYECWNDKYYCR